MRMAYYTGLAQMQSKLELVNSLKNKNVVFFFFKESVDVLFTFGLKKN